MTKRACSPPVGGAETTFMQPVADPTLTLPLHRRRTGASGCSTGWGFPARSGLPHIDTPRWLWQPTWRRRWLRWLAVLAVLYVVSVLLHNAAAGYTAVAAIAVWLAAWFKGRRYEVTVPPRSAVTVVFNQKTGKVASPIWTTRWKPGAWQRPPTTKTASRSLPAPAATRCHRPRCLIPATWRRECSRPASTGSRTWRKTRSVLDAAPQRADYSTSTLTRPTGNLFSR